MTRDQFLELLSQKLRGSLTPARQQQFEAACLANPEYAQIADEMLKPAATTADLPTARLTEVWTRIADARTPNVTHKIPRLPVWLRVAAIVVVFLAASLTIYFTQSARLDDSPLSLAATGVKVFKTLDDGTKVFLNHHSSIYYNPAFGKKKRAITLHGEAFFDVAKNPAVPLQIGVANIQITVKGTAFHVVEYQGKVAIALLRGYISVRNNRGKVIDLQPGELLTATGNALAVARLDTNLKKQATRLTNDSLVFRKEKLANLAILLESKYKVKIVIKTEQLKLKKFSGVVKKEKLGEALDALKLSYPFSYVIKDTTVIIK